MLLRVTVPQAYAAFQGGVLDKWYIEEGDTLSFGTVICDISIDEIVGLRRTKRASLLGSASKIRLRRVNDGLDRRQGRGAVLVRLTSAENGMVLHSRDVDEGERVAVGTLVALLGPEGESIEEGAAQAEARIAADFPDPEEFDPFDD